ncbi:PREDICTED: trans-1,2-dihydrobenzene-1,2-diol dehydrogenase [Rhagoletis zephyria]|uniref:trans-1,2-dihydrobenzene-1,2-diol dehydrogenase n=1 Tax=Rhagoletis zephyria TaxID=28612 RepID=UPI000811A501|nr:PREDICTED: trans-1,2-dihydrobenzene-1,2-diol dehydrogenase [Rhagoletis zephyria]
MPVLKWGIAAAGRITHDFVTALSTIEQSQHMVVAVADVEEHRARDFAKRHEIPKYYDGFDALSLDAEVDVVYVGTLNPFHYRVVRLMLERSKHVLCEKPLCLSVRQAEELYRVAKERNVFLMEGMWSRCFPSYARLHELLLADCIGEVTHIQVQHGFRADVERILQRSLGGSITLDIGLYALQLGQFVYGCAPIGIKCNAHLNSDGVDVESEFILDYGKNRKLAAFISGLENLDNCAKLLGTKGEIKLNNYWCCTSLTKPGNATESWPLPAAKFEFNHTNSCGLRYEAEEVRKCIEKRLLECPLYTHAQSLELIRIEEEIRRQINVNYDDVLCLDL